MFTRLIRNQVIPFISSNYIIYAVQFANSILIAKLLGPFNFGIWGFITLVLQYSSYSNLGTPYSLNVLISTLEKDSKNEEEQIFNRILFLTIIVSLVIIIPGFIIEIFNFPLFSKFTFSKYAIEITLITVLRHFNMLYMNLYRTRGSFWKIIFTRAAFPFFTLAAIALFYHDLSVKILLHAYVLSELISFIIYNIRLHTPIIIKYFNFKHSGLYLTKGFYLFIYNMSFMLIALSTRTIVSIFYEVDDLGIYSFSDSLVRGIYMGINAFAFVIYSKLIYKLRASIKDVEAIKVIKNLREVYVLLSFFIGFLAIIIIQLGKGYFPEFENFDRVFILLLLSNLIINNSIGYAQLLISRNQEIRISKFAFIVVIINSLIGIILVYFKFDYFLIPISNVICSFVYTILVVRGGYSLISQPFQIFFVLKRLFPYNIMIPFSLIFVNTITYNNNYFYSATLVLYTILNVKELFKSINSGLQFLMNPSLLKK